MRRQASVIVADDMTVSLLGKINLSGVYTADILIPADPFFISQLVFLFSTESEVDDPFQQIRLQVIFPGQQPRHLDVQLAPGIHMPSGRKYSLIRQPFLLQSLILRPGQIEAKVIHDKGEIEVTSLPWISLLPAPLAGQT
jgi:hypothetical protein